ncbi:phage scaffolding protein [Enterococcus sp. AZ163]|uniref:phage scaffolding protein n=1 Tax=Enterococcus sp. AZ163 TaxID=2774638 RepID=UPI003D288E4C
MKREQLKELGLSDEQIGSIMALHGQTVNELNKSVATAEQERDQFKEQLATNQTELDSLKESAKGNEELTQQLTDLQEKFNSAKTESETKLAEQQKDFAIKLALKEAQALDEDIVLSQLDKDTIKVVDGKLQGFEEQLKGLQESKTFLFQQEENTPATPKIVVGGNPQGAQEPSGTMKQQMKSEAFNLTQFLQKEGEK